MPDNYITAWRLVYYPGSGNYLVAAGGQKICRYDNEHLYFWDGRNRHEVSIGRSAFEAMLSQPIRLTATPLQERGR